MVKITNFFRHIRAISAVVALSWALYSLAQDPMATNFTYEQCQGSMMPYPTNITPTEYPDSLHPIFINHIGRHGSRYPASATYCNTVISALQRADSINTITKLGKELLNLAIEIKARSDGKWGALDSLGEAEQRLIASRMHKQNPKLFNGGKVKALSSYSPRAMMSMFAFTNQLDRLNNQNEFVTVTGRVNDPLLRPFDIDEQFIEFRKSPQTKKAYDGYFNAMCPHTAIDKCMGKDFPYDNLDEKLNITISTYYMLAGMEAMSMDCQLPKYFTPIECNALWSCFNLRQYIHWTGTTLSSAPADMATDLLQNIVETTTDYIDGSSDYNVVLRFGHAETLMPFLSLIKLPGCYYLTNYFDTVGQHWQDFHVVPMAANVQFILLEGPKGKLYIRCDLNEKPVPLLPGSNDIYVPWDKAKSYFSALIYGVNLD